MPTTFSRRPPRAASPQVAAAFTLLALLGRSVPGDAAPLFKLVDDSTTIVRGVVRGVASHKDDKFLVFTITPRQVLKGGAAVDTPLQLVEERVFGSEKPYFAGGTEALILAVPLPAYSYYRESLPAGSYLRWTDPRDSASDVGALAEPAVAEAVARYLELGHDVPGLARHFGVLLASAVPRLRADALTAVEARHDVAAALDAGALTPVRPFLADEKVSIAERGAVLVRLAHAGAPGVASLAQELAATHGPLQAAALEAMVEVGKGPPAEQLLALSRSEDPALRLAAVRGLTRLSSKPVFERIADVVRGDPSPQVRLAAIEALGSARDARAVDVLAQSMRSSDKGEFVAASQALGRIASPEAVRALAVALRDGSADAATAAAFALKQTDTAEAVAILRQQRDLHPDPQVRKAIKLALGEQLEEHED